MDLTALSKALPRLQKERDRTPQFHCFVCALSYTTAWFHVGHSRCFFCMRFRSPSVTRYALLYETPWYFLQSGQDDAYLFYLEYMEQLHRWADGKKLPFTDKEYRYQRDLLQRVEPPPL